MIRWSEERDCYRVRLGWFPYAPVAGIGAVLGPLAMFHGVWNESPLAFLMGAGVAVGGWLALMDAVRRGAWIEVLMRGRGARWHSVNGSVSPDAIEVRRFARAGTHDSPGWIQAELPDGSVRVVLVHEDIPLGTDLDRIVTQLNEMVEASVARPPGIVA